METMLTIAASQAHNNMTKVRGNNGRSGTTGEWALPSASGEVDTNNITVIKMDGGGE